MRRLHYSCHKLTDASLTNYLYICSTSGNNANIENNTYFSWQSTELGIIFSLSNAPVGDINTKRKWWIIFIRVSNWDCIIQNEKNPFYYKDLCGTVANYLKKKFSLHIQIIWENLEMFARIILNFYTVLKRQNFKAKFFKWFSIKTVI